MMILKAPLELKNRTDFVRDHAAFGERITGSYQLMGLEIGAEELLHITSAPPEIYLAEGGATTIVGNTFIASRNEEKLNVINNLLNRILVSVDAPLTYQDRAYITDTLYKLGIRDDRRFMSEVRKFLRESRLEEDFVSNYLAVQLQEESRELRQETLRLSREIVQGEAGERVESEREFLAREIMHRLQTGAIYQIVANFNKTLGGMRIELAQQMLSEQENIAKRLLVQNFLTSMEREGAELFFREETASGAPEETEQAVSSARGTQIVLRTGENTYERELTEKQLSETEVTEKIAAAVLVDVVKNLYHTAYENLRRGDVWMEYRDALYHSAENTVNRINEQTIAESYAAAYRTDYTDVTSMNLDYTEFQELSEIEENEGNIERIENQIREMNESNLQNVSRYEQMTEILKRLSPERRAEGGRERTQKEALAALADNEALQRALAEGEGIEEQRRRDVFHEITRLFPDNAAEVYNVVEQYLANPASVQGVNVSAGNVAQAAQELMILQQANERNALPAEAFEEPPAEEELFFKREERLTEEELTDILDTYQRRENRQVRNIGDTIDVSKTQNVTSTTVTQNTERTLSEREIEDIEEMVTRGVRSQMGAISDQVLTKLEKRLRNEKSRRGI